MLNFVARLRGEAGSLQHPVLSPRTQTNVRNTQLCFDEHLRVRGYYCHYEQIVGTWMREVRRALGLSANSYRRMRFPKLSETGIRGARFSNAVTFVRFAGLRLFATQDVTSVEHRIALRVWSPRSFSVL